MKAIELGVELELEHASGTDRSVPVSVEESHLVQDVGYDCTLDYGREIRFNHPTIEGWKSKRIKQILDALKTSGFHQAKNRWNAHTCFWPKSRGSSISC